MNTNYQTLVSRYLGGFYTAYEESHGASLQAEDLENDFIENRFDDEEGAFGEADCAGL